MDRPGSRLFSIDGDMVEVKKVFNDDIGQFLYDYPDFKEFPRITPKGRRWVNVTNDGCPYADTEYNDCGSCEFFTCEKPGDLIGVCNHEKLRTKER